MIDSENKNQQEAFSQGKYVCLVELLIWTDDTVLFLGRNTLLFFFSTFEI